MRGVLPSHKKKVDDYFARRFEQERNKGKQRSDGRHTLQWHPPETRTLTREEYRAIYGI